MNAETQDSKQDQRNGGGCLVPIMFVVAIVFALLLGGVGGLMLEGEQLQRIVSYPDIPAPAPETLNFVPSAQTFAERGTCADPTAPVAGWEKGVGGQLPPCWASWSREEQNAFLRSH